jgi:hypothetical protein
MSNPDINLDYVKAQYWDGSGWKEIPIGSVGCSGCTGIVGQVGFSSFEFELVNKKSIPIVVEPVYDEPEPNGRRIDLGGEE